MSGQADVGEEGEGNWRQSIFHQLVEKTKTARGLNHVVEANTRLLSLNTILKKQLAAANDALELAEEESFSRNRSFSTVQDGAVKDELLRFEKEKGHLNEKIGILNAQLAEKNAEVAALTQDKFEKSQGEIELWRSVKKLETELAEKNKLVEEQKAVMETLQEKLNTVTKDLNQKTIEFDTFYGEHVAMQLEFNSVSTELAKLRVEYDGLLARWLQEKAEEAEKMNSLNEQRLKKKQQEVQRELADVLDTELNTSDVGPVKYSTSELPERPIFDFAAHEGDVYDCKFSPRGSVFATAGSDKKIKLWNTAAQCQNTLSGHVSGVACLDFDDQEEHLVSGGYDSVVHIWNLKQGRSRHKMTGHTDKIYDVKFSADGNRVFSCSQDRTIKLWNAKRGIFERSLFVSSTCWALTTGFSGDCLFSAHFDKSIKTWDTRSNSKKPTHEFQTDHNGPITSIVLHPEGQLLLSAAKDHMLKAIDWRIMEVVSTYNDQDFRIGNFGCKVTYSPDARYVVSGSDDGRLFFWNARTGKKEKVVSGHRASVTACAWSPQGEVVSAGKDKQVIIWTS